MRHISAEIVSVGTELLLGRIVNANAPYLARHIAREGIHIYRFSCVGDNKSRLSALIDRALGRTDIVIISGGLGPTVDDITMAALADAFACPLYLHNAVLRSIQKRYPLHADAARQAYVPQGAKVIHNKIGTAPGIILVKGNKTCVALPGPPRELAPMVNAAVVPFLKKKYGRRGTIVSRIIRTAGVPESTLNKKLVSFLRMGGPATVGIYAKPRCVDIIITAKAPSVPAARHTISALERKILARIRDAVYGFDSDTLEAVIGAMLKKRHMRLAVAES